MMYFKYTYYDDIIMMCSSHTYDVTYTEMRVYGMHVFIDNKRSETILMHVVLSIVQSFAFAQHCSEVIYGTDCRESLRLV